jgi:predicted NAD/FAD-dependent oxidoreductase
VPNLYVCGDYVEGPYPATLEAAVRSGITAGQNLRAE